MMPQPFCRCAHPSPLVPGSSGTCTAGAPGTCTACGFTVYDPAVSPAGAAVTDVGALEREASRAIDTKPGTRFVEALYDVRHRLCDAASTIDEQLAELTIAIDALQEAAPVVTAAGDAAGHHVLEHGVTSAVADTSAAGELGSAERVDVTIAAAPSALALNVVDLLEDLDGLEEELGAGGKLDELLDELDEVNESFQSKVLTRLSKKLRRELRGVEQKCAALTGWADTVRLEVEALEADAEDLASRLDAALDASAKAYDAAEGTAAATSADRARDVVVTSVSSDLWEPLAYTRGEANLSLYGGVDGRVRVQVDGMRSDRTPLTMATVLMRESVLCICKAMLDHVDDDEGTAAAPPERWPARADDNDLAGAAILGRARSRAPAAEDTSPATPATSAERDDGNPSPKGDGDIECTQCGERYWSGTGHAALAICGPCCRVNRRAGRP